MIVVLDNFQIQLLGVSSRRLLIIIVAAIWHVEISVALESARLEFVSADMWEELRAVADGRGRGATSRCVHGRGGRRRGGLLAAFLYDHNNVAVEEEERETGQEIEEKERYVEIDDLPRLGRLDHAYGHVDGELFVKADFVFRGNHDRYRRQCRDRPDENNYEPKELAGEESFRL